MPLFCDHCGFELKLGALRPDSRFCSSCGKALSQFVKDQSTGLLTPQRKKNGQFGAEKARRGDDGEWKDGRGGARDGSGRKRKTTVDMEESELNDSNSEDSNPTQKRGRGRPRKYHNLDRRDARQDSSDEGSRTKATETSDEVPGKEVPLSLPHLISGPRKGKTSSQISAAL